MASKLIFIISKLYHFKVGAFFLRHSVGYINKVCNITNLNGPRTSATYITFTWSVTPLLWLQSRWLRIIRRRNLVESLIQVNLLSKHSRPPRVWWTNSQTFIYNPDIQEVSGLSAGKIYAKYRSAKCRVTIAILLHRQRIVKYRHNMEAISKNFSINL